ncbi:MAG: MoaD/ThiS family protein [Myxococcota bacterium]
MKTEAIAREVRFLKVHFLLKGYLLGTFLDHEFDMELPEGTTLMQALRKAGKERRVDFDRVLEEHEVIRESILVSGERLAWPGGLERRLEEGDSVYMLSPLAGG